MEWIKIEGPDTLPKAFETVWATNGKDVCAAWYIPNVSYAWWNVVEGDVVERHGMDAVTHWMPFVKPAPPTGKE